MCGSRAHGPVLMREALAHGMEGGMLAPIEDLLGLLQGALTFLVTGAVMGVALTKVRAVAPRLGYALAGLAGARLIALFLGRATGALQRFAWPESTALPIAQLLLKLCALALEVGLWSAVVVVVYRLATSRAEGGQEPE